MLGTLPTVPEVLHLKVPHRAHLTLPHKHSFTCRGTQVGTYHHTHMTQRFAFTTAVMLTGLEDTTVSYEDLAELEHEFDDVDVAISELHGVLLESLYHCSLSPRLSRRREEAEEKSERILLQDCRPSEALLIQCCLQ